jgi:curved DNA-binding protein CbpA
VQRDATLAELRAAYRRLALDAHPDRHDPGAPADAMTALNAAWDVLGDPARRAEYDRVLDGPRTAPSPGAAGSTPRPPRHAAAARATGPEPEVEPGWVDLTGDLRKFRVLMTAVVVCLALIMVLVFVFIIWPQSA